VGKGSGAHGGLGGGRDQSRMVRRRRLDEGPRRRGEFLRRRWRSGDRSAGSRWESGQEASSSSCRAGGELGEVQEEAERRDDGEVDRRRWIERPARRSSGTSVREWRRTSYEASVECSGAGGARDCGCGVAEAVDDSEQRVRRSCGDAERRKNRGSKIRPRERVKVVEEYSWACGGA
jgi:hypothetical protein